MPVSNTIYGGTSGRPALSSNGSRIVLAFKNGNGISVHTQTLPYSSAKWNTTPVNSPTFPVSVSGIPAIAYISGSTNKFVIMVRGSSSGAGLYWIYFNGSAFEGNWTRSGIFHEISSDPSLEYDSSFGALTLYFRSRNELIQTSVQVPGELGALPIHAIANFENEVLIGAPRAAWPAGIEGTRSVIIRGYNDSVTSSFNRHIMRTDTKGAASPW